AQRDDVGTELWVDHGPQQLSDRFDVGWTGNHNIDCTVAASYNDFPNRRRSQHVITLTDTAAVKVKELLEAEGALDLALRVAVRPGGCSGFSYEMFFDGDVAADDEKATFGNPDATVNVVVDAQSAQMLQGATLDYKDGLNQAGFSINNPNASRTCGCGSSFS
ncbi:MAG: iron-sulfur cluster insertion protein, partial [Ilumatobacteraceae bacterium]|nr:iron-sulfur cluster insertion protein [Ilumatobacteraceae bacterium]